jgi:hypothetical protein
VPLDGSPVAEAALPTAIELARENAGAGVTLVRAVEATSLPGGDAVTAQVIAVRRPRSISMGWPSDSRRTASR